MINPKMKPTSFDLMQTVKLPVGQNYPALLVASLMLNVYLEKRRV